MSISYEPLWQMLNEMNVTKMELAKMIDISNATLAKLSKNEPITLTTVDKICTRFNCKIENVVKHIPEIHITHSPFLVEKSMIVLADDMSNLEPIDTPSGQKMFACKPRPHVVLDILSPEMDNDTAKIEAAKNEDLWYVIAPIFTGSSHPISPLDMTFFDVEIDEKVVSGYVSIGKYSIVDSGLLKKRLGTMPSKYMNSFTKTLFAIVEAVNDEDK